jgi:protoheme IX farnesyltransferase
MSSYAATGATRAVPLWRDLLVLLEPRIDALVVLVAVAGAVASGETRSGRIGLLAAASFTAAAGASALNHHYERGTDALMERTRARPLPAGRVAPAVALVLGVVLVSLSQLLALPLGLGVGLYLLAGALTYALVYTRWLKPRTPWAVVWGGAAGSFAVLAGWQAHASTWRPAPQVLAAVLFLWTPSHVWSFGIARADDYRRSPFPLLTSLLPARRAAAVVRATTLGLVVTAAAAGLWLHWPYLVVAVPAGLWLARQARLLQADPSPEQASAFFKRSCVYLLALVLALVVQSFAS